MIDLPLRWEEHASPFPFCMVHQRSKLGEYTTDVLHLSQTWQTDPTDQKAKCTGIAIYLMKIADQAMAPVCEMHARAWCAMNPKANVLGYIGPFIEEEPELSDISASLSG